MHSAVSGVAGALVRLFRLGGARWCAHCGGYARHDAWEVHHVVVDQPRTYATRIEVTATNPVGPVRRPGRLQGARPSASASLGPGGARISPRGIGLPDVHR